LVSGDGTYTGIVATRCVCPVGNSGQSYANQASIHVARTAIARVKVADANWYVSGDTETPTGGTLTLTRTIEYPIGSTPQRILYSGVTTGSAASGTTIESDWLDLGVTIPEGARFIMHGFFVNAGALPYCQSSATSGGGGLSAVTGESFDYSATVLTDRTGTAGANFSPQSYGTSLLPLAIIGATSRPSFGLIGDSRIVGVGESTGNQYMGQAERAVAERFGYCKLASSGSTMYSWVASATRRLAALQYCSHVILGVGINDIVAGATAAVMTTNLKAIIAAVGNKPFYMHTIPPRTTNANGTGVHSSNTIRTEFNLSLTNGLKELAGVIDINSLLDDGTGQWLQETPALTADGVHETTAGNLKLYRASYLWAFLNTLKV